MFGPQRTTLASMDDPTRIPRVLAQLRETWEGQPDLPLTTLFGILANRGVGWGATDEELVLALQEMAVHYPAELPRTPQGTVNEQFLIVTEAPSHRITITPTTLITRNPGDPQRQPGLWEYTSIRATGPGRPLVVTDTSGIEHRLGVVRVLQRLASEGTREFANDFTISRAELGNSVWLVRLTSGDTLLIDRTLRSWSKQRRQVDYSERAWEKITIGGPAHVVAIAPHGGGPEEILGHAEKVWLLEE